MFIETEVELDLSPEDIYEVLSPSEQKEMAKLLNTELDVNTDDLTHNNIKDFVYRMKFYRPELFQTLSEEVLYYESR